MSEYIRKDKAIKALWFNPSYADPLNVLTQARDVIENIIPADVRPIIHGHWELKYPTREEIIYCQERYFCSNCKNYVVDRIARLEFNFCPNCGADMREPVGEKGEI